MHKRDAGPSVLRPDLRTVRSLLSRPSCMPPTTRQESERSNAGPPVVMVAIDHFELTVEDCIFAARLDASVAVCFYDAVHEPGALLHLRFVPRGQLHAELTDTVFTGDLLLIDQCVRTLRANVPQAKYWQSKLVAQIPQAEGVRVGAESVLEFLTAYLRDSNIKLVEQQIEWDGPTLLQFRPMMGQVRVQAADAA